MEAVAPVEEQRLLLEQNIAKLRKALQHWRQWDAEYEGLKEELLATSEDAGEQQLAAISKDFDGELVDEHEIRDLTGLEKPPLRRPRYIVNLIEKRQDYVQQNISTISKQLAAAEAVLTTHNAQEDEEEASIGDVLSAPGLPISEIIEELDEEGNVISSHVSQPEESTAKIVDTLRKAGITDMNVSNTKQNNNGTNITKEQNDTHEKENHKPALVDSATRPRPVTRKKSVSFSDGTKPPAEPSTAASAEKKSGESSERKSVSFAEEVEQYTIPAVVPETVGNKSVDTSKKVNESLISGSFGNDSRVIELDDDDDVVGIKPVIPENESEEDAHMRREMLQYSLNEIGPIVAELSLEEQDSDFDDVDEFDDEELGIEDGAMTGDTSDEDEDEYGRTKKKVISDEYRQQMLDLEVELEAKLIGNLGPQPEGDEHPDIDPEDLRTLVIRPSKDENQEEKAAEDVSAKKSVRFSENLDVQRVPLKPAAQPKAVEPAAKTQASPMTDVVEESPPSTASAAAPEPPKPTKPSRFKQRREQGTGSDVSSNKEDSVGTASVSREDILSDQIMESETALRATAPSKPDEFDPEIQQRQLANEYYRMRNNMIRQQGGFRQPEDEDPDEPLMEEVNGKVKKVSRFKAARMR